MSVASGFAPGEGDIIVRAPHPEQHAHHIG